MQLFPHQQDAVDFLLSKRRCILADQPRVGKTLPTAVAAAQHLPALIVCPAIAKTVWQRAFATVDPSLTVCVVNGTKAAKTIRRHDVIIINYDLVQYVDPRLFTKFKTLVLDECHRIKTHQRPQKQRNPKTNRMHTVTVPVKRTEACMRAMNAIPRVYALSGTPIPNRPAELWPLLHGLGIYRLGYYDFVTRYARAWQAPWGFDVSGSSNLPELRGLMRPFVLRRKKEDVFRDYKQPQVSLITFDLPTDSREQDFDAEALVDNPDALLALEGLSEILREGGLRKVKPSVEFIEDLLQGEDKLVVFAHHKDVVHGLADGLKSYKPIVVTGDTPRKQRDQGIESFQTDSDTRVIIGNISAMSEGVDLSAADTIVFVEATWQTSALEQASSRVENVNKSGIQPCVYLLTIAASLDHTVLSKVLKKQGVIDQII